MSNTYEGSKDTVQPLDLNSEELEKLSNYLTKEHEQCLADRAGDIERWKKWNKQANSRLSREDAKARDSKLDMTLTRERMFQNSARLQTPIFQQDMLMSTKARRAVAQDAARELENVLDYVLDRENMMLLCDEWVEQFQMFPVGVVKTPFVTEVAKVKRWQEISQDEYEVATADKKSRGYVKRDTEQGTKYFVEVQGTKKLRRGAFPFVISIEDFLFPVGTESVDSAQWVTHRAWLNKSELKFRIKEGIYDSKDELGNPILEVLGKPLAERERILDSHLDEEKGLSKPKSTKQYEIMETYLEWTVDDEPSEIIVTWERKSGIILRAIYNFYHEYCRPFVVHQYRPVNGSIAGTPLTFMLEPLHRAYSASINQRLDAASLANEVAIMVPPGHPLLKIADRDGFRGGVFENTATRDEVFEMRVSEPGFSQLDRLESIFEQRADRISHLSEYSFGEEQIQRPTATGQTQIIEESKQPQYLQLERFRKAFALVVKHMLARYKQHYPEGLEYYIQQLDEEGMMGLERGVFSWPEGAIEDEIVIETKVSSATMSKRLRKEEMVALLDKVPQMYQTMMQMSDVATNPQHPSAMIAAKLLNGYQNVVDQFMTEFEVADKEQLNPSLIQEVQVAQQIQQMVQQLQSQMQQLSQQNMALQQQVAQLGAMAGAAQGGMGAAPSPQQAPTGPPGPPGPGAPPGV